MGELNGTNGTPNGAAATAPPPEAPAPDAGSGGARIDAARAEEMVARSVTQARDWLARRQITAEVVGPAARLSTREWLVRASFCLFAVVVMGVVVFSALGLLSSGEAVIALTPVATLTALIVGVYLGDRQSE